MLIAELLNRRNDKEVPLFMGKSILLPNGQQQLIAILPNIQILTTVNQEEEYIYIECGEPPQDNKN